MSFLQRIGTWDFVDNQLASLLNTHVLNASYLSMPPQISEILAFATGLVMMIICAVHGECKQAASDWYQYIRKVTHLARWTFRSFHRGWKPERQFPFDFGRKESEEDNANHSSIELKDDSTLVHVDASFVIDDEADQTPETPAQSSLVTKSKSSQLGDGFVDVKIEKGSVSSSNKSKERK